MRKLNLIYAFLISTTLAPAAFASLVPSIQLDKNIKPTGSYAWSLPTPGLINLYTNKSTSPVSFMYSVNYGSDIVVVRCPLNDVAVGPNKSYICWLPTGETAKVELKSQYFAHGASGLYAIIP